MSDLQLGPVIGKIGGGVEVHRLDVNHTHVSSSSGSQETVAVLDVVGRWRVAVKIDSAASNVTSSNQMPSMVVNGTDIARYTGGLSPIPGAVSGVVDGPVTIETRKMNSHQTTGDPSFTGAIFYWEEPEQQ